MNSFANAVLNQETVTENGMRARVSSANSCVDFFYSAGAMRGKDIIPAFVAALEENSDVALRLALWLRDAREGAGERKLFRDILVYMERCKPTLALRMLPKVPELGRWDDLLVFNTTTMQIAAFELISAALANGNKLAAKWMPRKGDVAVALRKFMKLSPKAYRKLLVGLTQVVETPMCAKQWDAIEFSAVPSQAHARYKNAFARNSTSYSGYCAKLQAKDPSVKINAGSIYPYEVIKGALYSGALVEVITAQWNALPNYLGNNKVLPMVDVSGSMGVPVGGQTSVTCMDVAVSLGLYCADKNTGPFKGLLTFSSQTELKLLRGDIISKLKQMIRSDWSMGTDLNRAFTQILSTAVSNGVPAEDMPEYLLILSDMQFDQCVSFTAHEIIRAQYEAAGYKVPKIVFWNLRASANTPVKFDTQGVALVSGFSPALMKAVLSADLQDFTPENVMFKTINSPRYDV